MRARNAAFVSGAGVYRSDEALMRTSASARRSLTPCAVISRTSTRRAGAVISFFATRRASPRFPARPRPATSSAVCSRRSALSGVSRPRRSSRRTYSPPAKASSSTPNTSPSAPTCPPRGRTSSILPTTPAGARTRSSASPGTKLTRPAASSGSRPRARRRWWGRILPISLSIAEALARRRARRDPDSPLVFHRDGIPIRR